MSDSGIVQTVQWASLWCSYEDSPTFWNSSRDSPRGRGSTRPRRLSRHLRITATFFGACRSIRTRMGSEYGGDRAIRDQDRSRQHRGAVRSRVVLERCGSIQRSSRRCCSDRVCIGRLDRVLHGGHVLLQVGRLGLLRSNRQLLRDDPHAGTVGVDCAR